VAAAPAAIAKLVSHDESTVWRIRSLLGPELRALAAAAGLGLAVAGLLLLRWPTNCPRAWRPVKLLAGAALAVSLAFDLLAIPEMNRSRSEAALVAGFRPHLAAMDEVYLFESDFGGSFNLYLGRVRFPILKEPSEAAALLASHRRIAIVAWRKPAQRILGQAGAGRIVATGRAAARNVVLVVN
jgi:hypothetical protein